MIFGEGPVIKNIAGDLNKLFLQGSRVGQPITNVEGDAAADQGTVDLLAAMDPVIQEVAVGMSGEESRHYTVSGTPPLSLANSLGMPLRSWSVDVLPYQEGSGDPSPSNVRPIHGTNKLKLFVEESYDPSATPKAVIDVPILSANKWDELWEPGGISGQTGQKIPQSNVIRSVNYIPVTPAGSIYVYNGVITATPMMYIWYYDENKNYLSNTGGYLFNSAITVPNNCYYIMFQCNAAYGTSYGNNIAINYPSTVTTYNPYNATVYTGTIGSEGGESRWGEVDLGTLTWRSNSLGLYSMDLDGIAKTYPNGQPNKIMFERYESKPSKTGGTYVDEPNVISLNANGYLYTSATTSPTGKCVFELITPITFSVPSVTIPTPTGSATTWTTAEDGTVDSMEVTYVGKS